MQHDTAAAENALDDFMTALNARDEAGVNDAFNFPHVRLASGTVTIFENRGDFTFAGFDRRTAAARPPHGRRRLAPFRLGPQEGRACRRRQGPF